MTPIVSIIMGSTSDLPVMEKAAQLLNDMHVPFEMNALSAHRTPEAVEQFAKNAAARGIKVIIAAAGMAAALPGVIAANTTLPVIGVPVKGSVLDGVDALYSIIQMPPGIHQRRDERRHPGRANPGLGRRTTGRILRRLQGRTEEENHQGQRGTERSEIRVQDELNLKNDRRATSDSNDSFFCTHTSITSIT